MKVKVILKPANEVVARLGLGPGGKAQQFHTNNVMRRMTKYMPYRTGATIKTMVAQTDIRKPEIVLRVPYARYLYYGVKMVDTKTGKGPAYIKDVGFRYSRGAMLRKTNVPLSYSTTKNAKAGPFWDRRLATAEGDTLAHELEEYLKRGSGT